MGSSRITSCQAGNGTPQMEQARASSLQWTAYLNACWHTAKQWSGYVGDKCTAWSDNLALFDHNDSRQSSGAAVAPDNTRSTMCSLTSLTMTMP
eukprot:1474880-Amphidinium_carterae.1